MTLDTLVDNRSSHSILTADADNTIHGGLASVSIGPKCSATPERRPALESIWRYLKLHDLPYQAFASADDTLNLLNLPMPFFNFACQGLYSDLVTLPDQPAVYKSESAVQCMADMVAANFIEMSRRAIALECQVEVETGVLSWEPRDSVVERFLKRHANSAGRVKFFHEYPVLASQLTAHATLWREASCEFLMRLQHDAELLAPLMHDRNHPVLSRVTAVGDRHRGGRAVLCVKFTNGRSVMYKPRSIATDLAFQCLLDWLANKGGPRHRLPSGVDRSGYGWTEFVSVEPCRSIEEVKRYYQRMGSLLGMFYVLGTTDFHGENIIARGEFPLAVDLETLISPRVQQRCENPDGPHNQWTVLQTGMLPNRFRIDRQNVVEEVSAVGGWEQEIARATDTDPMGEKSTSRPQLNGKYVNPRDFLEQLVDGFTHTYEIILNNRREFLQDGLLELFAKVPLRVVLRNTSSYVTLLKDRYHPDLLRDDVSGTEHFARLKSTVADDDRWQCAVAAEMRALEDDDIPYFWTTGDSTDLWTDSGECIHGFFSHSAFDETRRRIQHLSQADLQRQVWLIEQCLGMIPNGDSHSPTTFQPISVGVKTQASPHVEADACTEDNTNESKRMFLEEARRLADVIQRMAYDPGKTQPPEWTHFDDTTSHWIMMPGGNTSLFSGSAGIAFLFTYLAHVTGDCTHLEFARRCLRNADEWTLGSSVGAFGGLGGAGYVFAHVARLWNEPTWLKYAQEAARQIARTASDCRIFDLFNGMAGAAAALTSVYRSTQDSEFLDIAVHCGDRLIQSARSTKQGIEWSIGNSRPITGYGLGAAGIAWSLMNLGKETGLHRFTRAAQDALAYERSLFVESQGNWADVRLTSSQGMLGQAQQDCLFAVCHGAPGIGLARADSLHICDDELMRQEIRVAAESTLSNAFGEAHCLCHGDLGNVESVLRCADVLNDASLQSRGRTIAAKIVQDGITNGWRCGVPNYTATADFMMGLGGICYTLLRWAAPHRVPFVLTLDSPK